VPAATLLHRCRVIASPRTGVYATDIESARHYGRHWHTTYGFGVIDSGAHRSASPQGAVDAFEGDVVCTNPGESHDGRPLGGPTRRWRTVYVEPEVIASLAGRSDVAFARAAFTDVQVRSSIEHLLDCMERPGDALAFDEALAITCERMLRHSNIKREGDLRERVAVDDGLDRVRDRLADSPFDAPTLDELAALAGMGKFRLLRRFRRRFGVTPHDWLVQRRADRARESIRCGASLAEAAAACGFADQSHMTRAFVQRFGFTPGAWQAGAISFKTRG
jgi:AraC-like DNA-binding protein